MLKDLLNKRFIRVSNLEIRAPVLFIRKPGSGFYFYCNYRALNVIIRTDYYPLLLISEIFRIFKGIK